MQLEGKAATEPVKITSKTFKSENPNRGVDLTLNERSLITQYELTGSAIVSKYLVYNREWTEVNIETCDEIYWKRRIHELFELVYVFCAR